MDGSWGALAILDKFPVGCSVHWTVAPTGFNLDEPRDNLRVADGVHRNAWQPPGNSERLLSVS